jgi:hypothetical protein
MAEEPGKLPTSFISTVYPFSSEIAGQTLAIVAKQKAVDLVARKRWTNAGTVSFFGQEGVDCTQGLIVITSHPLADHTGRNL